MKTTSSAAPPAALRALIVAELARALAAAWRESQTNGISAEPGASRG